MQTNPIQTPILTVDYESDADKIARLEQEKMALQLELIVEKNSRFNTEKRVEELNETLQQLNYKRQKKEAKPLTEYSEFKTDGKRKARPAEAIRSYEDFRAIQQYFLDKKDLRDWMLWTIGVSLGLRISDLLSLKYKNILNPNGSFKKRITVIEQKTHKANNCLITESVIYAVTQFLNSKKWKYSLDDYLFMSGKTKSRMTEEYGWKILSDAGKALKLPFVVGSHTMRKSFANIAACADKSTVDMNSITKVQGLLNHSNQQVTMTYLGTYRDMYDRARMAVSDFVLGKTDIHEIVAGNNYTIDDLAHMLEQLCNGEQIRSEE